MSLLVEYFLFGRTSCSNFRQNSSKVIGDSGWSSGELTSCSSSESLCFASPFDISLTKPTNPFILKNRPVISSLVFGPSVPEVFQKSLIHHRCSRILRVLISLPIQFFERLPRCMRGFKGWARYKHPPAPAGSF